MREPVQRLLELGHMPDEEDDTVQESDLYVLAAALEALPSPCTDEEAVALLDAFPRGEASCFGLAWALLHHVETAPSWPIAEALDDRSCWVSLLRRRAENASNAKRSQ